MIQHKLTEARTAIADLAKPLTLKKRIDLLDGVRTLLRDSALATTDKSSKKAYSKFHNTTDGLISDLQNLDIGKKKLMSFRLAAMARLDELIEQEVASPTDVKKHNAGNKKTTAPELDAEDEDDENYSPADDDSVKKSQVHRDSDEMLRKLLDGAKEVIQKYSNSGNALKKLIAQDFILARAPIVPITKPPLDPDYLSKAGFRVQKIGFYPCLEGQLVLGLNIRYLIKVKKDLKRTPVQMAEFMVEQLNRRDHHHYMVMGPAIHHSTGIYFWLLTEKHANLLRKAAKSDHFLIRGNGFAFK